MIKFIRTVPWQSWFAVAWGGFQIVRSVGFWRGDNTDAASSTFLLGVVCILLAACMWVIQRMSDVVNDMAKHVESVDASNARLYNTLIAESREITLRQFNNRDQQAAWN